MISLRSMAERDLSIVQVLLFRFGYLLDGEEVRRRPGATCTRSRRQISGGRPQSSRPGPKHRGHSADLVQDRSARRGILGPEP